jgi:3-dehydroquinate synthase
MKTNLPEHIELSVPGKKITIPIYIGSGIFQEIKSIIPFNKYSSVLVITDENVSHHWDKKIHEVIGNDAGYMAIPTGESNKSLSNVEKIWNVLSKKGFDRKSLVINIGGGMVCDLGAFAADTFMRGISYMQIPTTLLAQADAAMGGKTGFNFNGTKNMIGTFSAPVAVISDSAFLSTLPQREFRSGFAEIIKHSLIADSNLLEHLLNINFTTLADNSQNLAQLLSLSAKIKCAIIHNDPFEKDERKKLNFGHTVGHAIEMACNNKFLHGEAVAIGMIAESRMSFLSGYLSETKFRDIENLVGKAKLPAHISPSFKDAVLKIMLSDKKNVKKQIRWAFLEDIGNVKVDVTLPDEIVDEGLNYILK